MIIDAHLHLPIGKDCSILCRKRENCFKSLMGVIQIDVYSFASVNCSNSGKCYNKKDLYTEDFSKAWKKKNIYDQAIYKKFVSGYFFHENERVEIEFDQEELRLIYAVCMSYKKSIPKEGKQTHDIWKLARKITGYMEDKGNV